MEICSVFGSGFHHTLTSPSPSAAASSSSAVPLSSTTIRAINNFDFTATVTSTTIAPLKLDETHKGPTKSSPNLRTVFRKTKQSAIFYIQESSDLESALSRSGGILRVQDLNVILRHFGKLNRWKELSQLFDWMQQNEKTNIASYSSYIKFVGKSLSPLKALDIYSSIRDEATRTNVSVCNSILSCMVRSGKFESSLKMFHQMKRDGLKPDIVTYSTLLVGCVKVKDGYSKALELVKELKYNGLSMDSVIYVHGNYKKAENLIQDMRSAGLELNKVILTTLLKVYVRSDLFEKSRVLLNELENLGYAADEMPYCILMDGLVKSGQTLEAKSVFDDMMKKKVRTDGYSYSIMISAFCHVGLLQEAKQLISDYEANYQKYDVVILNSMLCAYCRAGEMDNVMKMMKKMDELAISPDWNTFHILIKYFCSEKLYILAYRTMEDMHKKGHQVEEELCCTLMFHLGKTGAYGEAFSVYNMLRYSKRTMNKSLHEKLLHILVRGRLLKEAYVIVKDNGGLISPSAIKKFATSFMQSGNINLVNDVIKTIHSFGFKINQELFHSAVSRYLEETQKKDLLLQLLQWMPGQGYFVDSSTRNLILKNAHLFGRQTIAELLSKQHIVSKTVKKPQQAQVVKKKREFR